MSTRKRLEGTRLNLITPQIPGLDPARMAYDAGANFMAPPRLTRPVRNTLLVRPPDDPAEWIDDRSAFENMCAELASLPIVAVDTESNSMHAYQERTCIVQITGGGRNTILDALALGDLSALGAALDRSELEVILHGGDYDITCLTRDHNFRFHRVFDTMIAATLLGIEKVGLANLVEAHFGVHLDKKHQRADWARRPLSAEQLDYLRRDTIYLPALREHLRARLAAEDLAEEADIEFARLARRRGSARQPDPEGWRRTKGAHELDGRGRAVLRRLHAWREIEAERRDLPPFKVIAPHKLIRLAGDSDAANRLPGLSPGESSRHGASIVAAIERGAGDYAGGEVPPRRIEPTLTAQQKSTQEIIKRRDQALRAWRRTELQGRNVPSVVVLPNPAIAWLAENAPTAIEQLTDCPDIGAKRIARYGEEILAVF